MSVEYANYDNESNVLKNGRITVAVLAGSMSSAYQEGIMRGAADVAKEKGFNIIGFSGGPFRSPDPLAQSREKLFELVDTNLVDGIIIPVSSHSRYLSEKETFEFIKRFSSVPVINIGGYIEGYTNIIPDYEAGMSKLMEHFVHIHGYRRIAFFRGPENHASSEQRMKLYMKLMDKYGLPIDKNLIVYGDLRKNAAQNTIEEFLDIRKETCEAIIAVNDNQALGIIEALKQRGIRVPQDIAIAGSMGIPEGMFSEPSLTTIKEPMYELGRHALMALAKKIEGKEQPKKIFVPTKLIIRNSCGCESKIVKKPCEYIHAQESLELEEDLETYVFTETKNCCMKIFMKYNCSTGYEDIQDLLPKYYHAMLYGEHTPFICALRRLLEKALKNENIIAWLAIATVFQYNSLRYLDVQRKTEHLIKLISNLIFLKDEMERKAVVFQSFETDFYINFFREIVNNLNSSFDLNAVRTYAIRMLDLSDCYISVYDNKNAMNDTAINVLAVRNKEIVNIDDNEKRFTKNKLIPQSIKKYQERYTLMVFPLSFRKEPLGFLMLNLSKRKGSAYENMQAIISTALKNELQIQELKEAEERFSDIAHSTSDWLWETDSQNRFTYCSSCVVNVLGYTAKEMLGRTIFDFLMPKSTSYEKRMGKRENLVSIECWKSHKNGNSICLLISAKPIIKDSVFIGYRGVFKDITKAKFQEEKIKKLAYFDILTGLPNRTMFHEKLQEIMKSSERYNQRFALMFLDMDRFKYVNDSMGHSSGDILLKKVSEILRNSIRSSDTLARLGGDEFTIIVPNIRNEEEVCIIAKRIIKNLAPPITINGNQIFVTISIGISVYPIDGNNSLSILKNADTAMYRAKDQGRNQYVFYDRQIEKKNASRIQFEGILYNAIKNNEFILEYQPKVDSVTGKVKGLEALVRIDSKEHGIIPPNNFIPLAEELGLIGYIDEWVFQAACIQYEIWRKKGYKSTRIAVNLSAVQLQDKELVSKYMHIIKKYNVNPQDIQLEITENALIENEDIALVILESFKEHGISIALDDFGTGYSSLRCIKIYPIDTVKIDRLFVKDSFSNPKNVAIISAIMHMANSLNLRIVAEGIETLEQYKIISSLGCNEIQGYYFCKPCRSEHIEEILNENFCFKFN